MVETTRKRIPFTMLPVGPLNGEHSVDLFEQLYTKTRKEIAEDEKRRAKRAEMRARFRFLMAMSDDQLRVYNSNQINLQKRGNKMVYYPEDKVFVSSKLEEKRKFEERRLSREEYHNLRRNPSLVKLDLRSTDREKLHQFGINYFAAIDRQRQAKEYGQEEGFEINPLESRFRSYVLRLLNGEKIPRKKIEIDGMDPNSVTSKARTLCSRFSGF